MWKMKAVISVLTTVLLLLSFTGCSGGEPNKVSASSSKPVSSSAPSSSSQISSSTESSSAPAAVSSAPAQSSSATSSKAPAVKKAPSSSASVPKAETVTLTVDGSKGGAGILISAEKETLKSGDTVYSLLNRVCNKKGVILSPQNAPGNVYVDKIGALSEFDCGSQSGWIYSVNGSYPGIGCNAYSLKAGDTVRWVYTLDSGSTERSGGGK